MPRARWDALRRGDDCPLCAEVISPDQPRSGRRVAELSASQLWLNHVQYVPGFSHVVSRAHVVEPYELPSPERYRLFDDVMDASHALDIALGASKLNIVSHGNSTPHAHFHLKPRFYGDPGGSAPVRPSEQPVRLAPDELAARLEKIRGALRLVRSGSAPSPHAGATPEHTSPPSATPPHAPGSATREWIPRARWEALRRGEGCTLCEDLRTRRDAGPAGFRVAPLRVSDLWLHRNQAVPGWCYVVYRGAHVVEPYHLAREEQHHFFDDIAAAARAVQTALGATKINLEMHGNAMPHLHCHVKPRIYGDRWGNGPIYPDRPPLRLTDAEYAALVRRIRDVL